jgi:hypothetical protein
VIGLVLLTLGALGVVGYYLREPVPPLPDPEPPPAAWFQDVTEAKGLHFQHVVGAVPLENYFLPHLLGSGVALFDFNNDGRLDIYLIQNGGPGSSAVNRLFRQEEDGRFTDVSKGSGLDVVGHGMGVAIGDINNDGWPDVLLTEYGGIRLFLNNGDGTFTDVTKQAGLDNPLWATSAAFIDYDRDGWLDLVVTNYVAYDPTRSCSGGIKGPDYCTANLFPGSVTRLFRNKGVRGQGAGAKNGQRPGTVTPTPSPLVPNFEDVTISSGLGRLPGPGLGVVCADFNGDHWPDILVANDGQPNRLWINQRNGTFKDEAIVRGLALDGLGRAKGSRGIALGDVDGDGFMAVFMTHLTEETNTLWKQEPPGGVFHDETGAARLLRSFWHGTGFGTVLGDFDHDGRLDLAVVNGRIQRDGLAPAGSGPAFWEPYVQRNQLFANRGRGRFFDLSPYNPDLCSVPAVARGLACGDVDGDGALDLLVTCVAGPARLYRNVAPDRGHWLMVRAIDPALGGRDAYGAEVTVHAAGRHWLRLINPGSSYLCSNDPRAHFGVGQLEQVDAIQVLWPDGQDEFFPTQPVDQLVILRKGSGKKEMELPKEDAKGDDAK